jgi:hypothetical protein
MVQHRHRGADRHSRLSCWSSLLRVRRSGKFAFCFCGSSANHAWFTSPRLRKLLCSPTLHDPTNFLLVRVTTTYVVRIVFFASRTASVVRKTNDIFEVDNYFPQWRARCRGGIFQSDCVAIAPSAHACRLRSSQVRQLYRMHNTRSVDANQRAIRGSPDGPAISVTDVTIHADIRSSTVAFRDCGRLRDRGDGPPTHDCETRVG